MLRLGGDGTNEDCGDLSRLLEQYNENNLLDRRQHNRAALTLNREEAEMRFRFFLPAGNVILGLLLFHWGDVQVRRILVTNGGALEGITDVAARAKYVHYALNAPAWALLGDTRNRLWSPSTLRSTDELLYFLAVILLWFSIGLVLDRQLKGRDQPAIKAKWCKYILASTYITYGLFTCYSVFPRKSYVTTLDDYLTSLGDAVLRGGYGWWWYPLGLAWGLGLIVAGVYSLLRLRHDATH